eukprot:TRINITY_DN4118_c0_g1_i1.p1 TRINITY_DN4118_c0_g1~~TRINITY_DN4118_c0_g1_i1.p1  ORF type:complete len:195 (+),score=28.33 TRINITY_DN4118_c0_g1_i1:48-587(+)
MDSIRYYLEPSLLSNDPNDTEDRFVHSPYSAAGMVRVHHDCEHHDMDVANAPKCGHLSSWRRLRSKKDHAFFACTKCSKTWKLPTAQTQNFRVIDMLLSDLELENGELSAADIGLVCDHLEQWKRVRTKKGFTAYVCAQCNCRWKMPTPSTGAPEEGIPLSNGWCYVVSADATHLFGFY